jgi:16S rRNA (cytidine1402-2'-O)-methyltransferase
VSKPANPTTPGTLYVVATPLGNLSDMTARAVDTLRSVDAIAAEDTRRTRKLLSHFEIRTPLVSYHDHNEASAARRVVGRLLRGDDIALVSDAGTPLIADPGYRLVAGAVEAGVPIVPVPGPSAVAAALSVAGLPPQPFLFAGYLPRRRAARKRRLEQLADLKATLVFYESPHRMAAALRDMLEVLGDRPAVIGRELTKIHEEIIRGGLAELAGGEEARSWRGELVVLVAGADRAGAQSDESRDLSEVLWRRS